MSEKTVIILGATGVIGRSSVNIIANAKAGSFVVLAITGNNNVALLAQQAILLQVKIVVIANQALEGKLKRLLQHTNIKILSGLEALHDISKMAVDIVVSAIVGMYGFIPTLNAIRNSRRVALANKETIICGGKRLQQEIMKHSTEIIPIDSEHNAIFQIFANGKKDFEKIVLTASGGPFRGYNLSQLQNVNKEQAIKHPNWVMGQKISVDSSTLVNKGLELIEACYLFDIKQDDIEILIHKESIIHGMVQYKDGSMIAQLSITDMHIPISYSLYYPERAKLDLGPCRLERLASLTFSSNDNVAFPAISIARNAVDSGDQYCLLYNIANDFAVNLFLQGRIAYLDILRIIQDSMLNIEVVDSYSLDDIPEIADRICHELQVEA